MRLTALPRLTSGRLAPVFLVAAALLVLLAVAGAAQATHTVSLTAASSHDRMAKPPSANVAREVWLNLTLGGTAGSPRTLAVETPAGFVPADTQDSPVGWVYQAPPTQIGSRYRLDYVATTGATAAFKLAFTTVPTGTAGQLVPTYFYANVTDGSVGGHRQTAAPLVKTFYVDNVPPGAPAVAATGCGVPCFTNSLSVPLTITDVAPAAGDDATAKYCVTLDDATAPTSTNACWTATKPTSIALPGASADGTKSIRVWVQDSVRNVNPTAGFVSVTLDRQPPAGAGFALSDATSGSATLTNERTVAVAPVTCNCYSFYQFRTDTATPAPGDAGWVAGTAVASTYELPAGDGAKTVSLWLKDAAGNVATAALTASITLDTAPPTVTGFALSDATSARTTVTNARVVNVAATPSGASHHLLTENAGLAPAESNAGWVAGAPAATFELSSGDGAKTVFLWLKDSAGNVVAAPASATIALDTAAPTGASLSLADPTSASTSTTNDRAVNVAAAGSGFGAYLLTESAATPAENDAGWIAGTTLPGGFTVSATDGDKTVRLWLKDDAGNVAGPATATITLDTAPPTVTSLALKDTTTDSTTSTNSRTVAVAAATSGAAAHILTEDATFLPAEGASQWTSGAVATSYVLAPGDGSKTVYLWLKDAAGNVMSSPTTAVIALDTTPPTASGFAVRDTDTASVTITNARVVGVVLATADSFAAYVLTEDAGLTPGENDAAWVTATSLPATFTVSAGDGSKTVRLWLRDPAGNVAAAALTASIVLDTTPPTASGFALAPTVNEGTAAPSLTGSSGFTAYILTEDATFTPGPASSSWVAATSLPASHTLSAGDGTKIVFLWLRDAAGNVVASPLSAVATVDTLPPVAVAEVNDYSLRNATVYWNATDAGAGVGSVRVDARVADGAWATWLTGQPASGSATYASGVAGQVLRFRIVATDVVGHTESVPADDAAEDQTTIVTAAPSVAFPAAYTAGAPLVVRATTEITFPIQLPAPAAFVLEASRNGTFTTIATGALAATGGGSASATVAWDTAAWADGTYTLRVRIVDALGQAVNATAPMTLDNTPPDAQATLVGPYWQDGENVGFLLSATPAGGATSYRIWLASSTDNVTFGAPAEAPQTAPGAIGRPPSGYHRVFVRAVDAAGNVEPIAATPDAIFATDTTEPVVTATAVPARLLANLTITVSATDDHLSGVTLLLDDSEIGAGAASATARIDPAALAAGMHTLTAIARDAAGHKATWSATFVVDREAPVVAIAAPAPGAAIRGQLVLTFSATDDDAIDNLTFTLDGAPAVAAVNGTAAAVSLVGLADGEHVLAIRAVDASGNNATTTLAFKLDNTVPSLTAPGLMGELERGAKVTLLANDASGIARVEVREGDRLLATLTQAPFEYTIDLEEGSHTLRVTAVDAAGNSRDVTVTFDVNEKFLGVPPVASPLALLALALLAWARRRSR